MTELGKQVWKKMEEIGWENAPEGFHLEYYENIIECTKQVLRIPDVVGQSEELCVCDAPLIRTSDKGGEYCGNCGKDID